MMKNNFFLIAGPCVVESEELIMEVAEKVSLFAKTWIPYVFKSSYRKANRTSAASFTGIGDETALALVKKQERNTNCPLLPISMRMKKQQWLQNILIYYRYLLFFAGKQIC